MILLHKVVALFIPCPVTLYLQVMERRMGSSHGKLQSQLWVMLWLVAPRTSCSISQAVR